MIPDIQALLAPTSRALRLTAMALSIATALPCADHLTPRPAQPEVQASPGPISDDLHACLAAATPGPMHERLQRSVGVWTGHARMWLDSTPGAEPLEGGCSWTVTPLYGGRYIRCELSAELPGMGPFTGLGLTGYDNVSGQFVGDWIDDHSTGIMRGDGTLSDDGRTLAWTYTYNCPITREPAVVRQVETWTGDDTLTFEMFSTDPRSGREFKCMHIEFTRRP